MRLRPETQETAPCTVFSAIPLRRYSTSGCQFGMARAKLTGTCSSNVLIASNCTGPARLQRIEEPVAIRALDQLDRHDGELRHFVRMHREQRVLQCGETLVGRLDQEKLLALFLDAAFPAIDRLHA